LKCIQIFYIFSILELNNQIVEWYKGEDLQFLKNFMFLINLNLSFFLLPSGVVFFSYDFIDNVYEQFFFSYDHSFNNNIFTVGNAWYV